MGRGLNHIATPGYSAALHASWRGWTDGSLAAKHWYKPLYDAIQNNRQLVFDETAQAGLKYYATEAGEAAAKGPIKDWLLEILVPGPDTPVYNSFGLPVSQLGNSYRAELLLEQDQLLAELSALNLTPEQIAAYQADLLARQQAHTQILTQLQDHRQLLWDSYQDGLADEGKWWNFWGPLLLRWAVVGGATLAWDGPGFYVASAGYTSVDTIYDAVQDSRALAHDQKMLDQSLHFLDGRVSSAYTQIALNTVGALNMISAGDNPQIAGGEVGSVSMKSFGHYRVWPGLWWAEESSQVELPLTNTTEFTNTYLTSAGYTHTGFWTGAERLLPEGQSLELAEGEPGTAAISLKMEDDGVSPDENSPMDLLVLGATETGLYPVSSLQVSWIPTRIETLTGALAKAPAGYTSEEAANAPALPYPLSSFVTVQPDSTNHQLTIAVINPFTLTVSATVTQTIPADFTILDAGDGQVVGDSLVWSEVISPQLSLEVQVLLGWERLPGEATTLPGAELAFRDPDTGEGDTYSTTVETVQAAWPLEVSVDLPPFLPNSTIVTIPITLTNLSGQLVADGVFTTTLSTPDGTTLYSSSLDVSVSPGGEQVLSFPVQVSTLERYIVIRGEVALNAMRRDVFLEILAVQPKIFLPLVVR